jgi:galactose mutarotase-like enzyme
MSAIRVHRLRGGAAITLVNDDLTATFLPDVGMLGAAFAWRGVPLVALPRGATAALDAHTTGLPLLHPWANRLARRRYVAAGVAVDLRGVALHTDGNGLAMHGMMIGRPGWTIASMTTIRRRAEFTARFDYTSDPALMAAFPYPHVIEITVVLADALRVTTTVRPTEGPVPISFGWHPYLQVPGPRSAWRLRLPEREELVLNARMIPTGRRVRRDAEDGPIGTRTFDTGFALGDDRRFAIASGGVGLEVAFDDGYPFAQLWVPAGRRFCCVEPMTAPTNGLATDSCALATPDTPYSATYTLTPSAI